MKYAICWFYVASIYTSTFEKLKLTLRDDWRQLNINNLFVRESFCMFRSKVVYAMPSAYWRFFLLVQNRVFGQNYLHLLIKQSYLMILLDSLSDRVRHSVKPKSNLSQKIKSLSLNLHTFYSQDLFNWKTMKLSE